MKAYLSQKGFLEEYEQFFALMDKHSSEKYSREEQKYTQAIFNKMLAALEKKIQKKTALSISKNIEIPILNVFKKHNLTGEEQKLFMFILFSSIKRGTSVAIGDTLQKFYKSTDEVIKKTELFSPSGNLLKNKLLSSSQSFLRSLRGEESYLGISITVNPEVLNSLLNITKSENDEDSPFTIKEPRVDITRAVLKPAKKKEVEEIIGYIKNKKIIQEKIGLIKSIEKGFGCILLFGGPPGTGKTLLAEAIAKELDKKLCTVNYAQMTSKFVGETGKNIEKLFKFAEETKPVILLDEADALLSKRSSRETSNDYAYNQEVILFLQKIEEFDGVIIMTTNREVSLDSALNRRITYKVDFEIPDMPERKEIWKLLIPPNIPVDKNVDFSELATQYVFAGGHIKNAVLSAIIKAVSRSSEEFVLKMDDLKSAAEMESSKMEKKETHKIGFQ
ncbi:MAG: ATP-binding protein [bacterium]